MSDCSTRAFTVPEKPTIKRLRELNGEPPWELEVPFPDMLPEEALGLVGSVRMGGARFVRAGGRGRGEAAE